MSAIDILLFFEHIGLEASFPSSWESTIPGQPGIKIWTHWIKLPTYMGLMDTMQPHVRDRRLLQSFVNEQVQVRQYHASGL
jgi:hypothetical protein